MTDARHLSTMTKPPALPAADIPDVYHLTSVEQLRALADPLRYRMCMMLQRPATGAGLARKLGVARAKAHYHLKLLESVGLVRLHYEDASSGTVEKYYVIVGRLLDFSKMVPKSDALIPENIAPEMVSAISDFMATMLDLSREKALTATKKSTLREGCYFDFDSVLTPDQFRSTKAKLVALRAEIVEMTRVNEDAADEARELVPFHLTSYLLPTGTADFDS